MLDHVTLKVSDLTRSKAFYDAALKPLGITHLYGEAEIFSGYGIAPKAFFWIGLSAGPITGAHVAITAPDHAAVDAFYKAAMAAGAKDNGKPGPRPHYHANYYGAFVLDPDGHNIEAVCHLSAP
jgi:catechol 2,3-dioxygenase-like lactoylglutathione lyase family enzyme